MGGNFEILVFNIGKKKTDPSYVRLRVAASNKEKLQLILSELHRLGAHPLVIKDVHLVPAESIRWCRGILYHQQPSDTGEILRGVDPR